MQFARGKQLAIIALFCRGFAPKPGPEKSFGPNAEASLRLGMKAAIAPPPSEYSSAW